MFENEHRWILDGWISQHPAGRRRRNNPARSGARIRDADRYILLDHIKKTVKIQSPL